MSSFFGYIFFIYYCCYCFPSFRALSPPFRSSLLLIVIVVGVGLPLLVLSEWARASWFARLLLRRRAFKMSRVVAVLLSLPAI